MPAWHRPKHFDRNLIVIGAGAAGLVSAYLGSALRARVTLIESGEMGGDCLNTGCVPSKTLIHAARLMAEQGRAGEYGIWSAPAELDFPRLMARVRESIDHIAPHDSVERYSKLGVEVIQGRARLHSPWQVAIDTAGGEQRLSARHIIIATGARPVIPAIPGIDTVAHVSSESLWSLQALPRRLAVLGGGPIGCELAQAFARLGSEVTIIQRGPRLLPREDAAVSELLADALRADGVRIRFNSETRRCEQDPAGQQQLWLEQDGEAQALPFDLLLCATGRRANTDGLGLEALGVALRPDGTIHTDAWLRSSQPSILACGDVSGPFQFTHTASHQAWYATVNALFSGIKRFAADYRVIPWVTYTDPEVARVGLNLTEAAAQGIAVELSHYPLKELDRAIIEGQTRGFVQVLTPPGKDRILGVTIVGAHAGELLAEFVLAMKQGIGLNRILGTIHSYPGWSEAVRNSAGVWRRAHSPAWALRLLERFHRWRRGGG
ncbi:MAG: dihydrolipoyl dehydrogenase family protein [Thiohalomonadaceae bacterium]